MVETSRTPTMESSPAVRSGGFQGTSLFGSVDHTAHLWHRRMRTPTYIDLGWIMLNTFMVSYGFILERSWRVNIMWTSCFRNIFLWCRMDGLMGAFSPSWPIWCACFSIVHVALSSASVILTLAHSERVCSQWLHIFFAWGHSLLYRSISS